MKNNLKTKLIFLLIIFFGFFGLAKSSQAAPAVTNVSGTVEHGQNITISGVNFGTKPTAAPLKWDNFESYNVGDDIDTTGANHWTDGSPGNPTKASSTQAHAGAKSMHSGFSNDGVLLEGDTIYYDLDDMGGVSNATTVYLSTWIYVHRISETYRTRNIKYPRVTAASIDAIHGSPNGTLGVNGDSHTGVYSWTVNNFKNASDGSIDEELHFPEEQWHHFEYYLVRSSVADAADGIAWISIDGVTRMSTATAQTWITDASDGEYYKHVIPNVFYFSQSLHLDDWTYLNIPYESYFDDVYIDITPARVYLCSGSTWAARGTCEIQIPTAWAMGEITSTVNLGSLAGDTAYLYVCDADNVCNENGYEVALNGELDTTPPAAPSGLSVQ